MSAVEVASAKQLSICHFTAKHMPFRFDGSAWHVSACGSGMASSIYLPWWLVPCHGLASQSPDLAMWYLRGPINHQRLSFQGARELLSTLVHFPSIPIFMGSHIARACKRLHAPHDGGQCARRYDRGAYTYTYTYTCARATSHVRLQACACPPLGMKEQQRTCGQARAPRSHGGQTQHAALSNVDDGGTVRHVRGVRRCTRRHAHIWGGT